MSHKLAGEFLNFNYVFDLELDIPNQHVYEYLLRKKWNKIGTDENFGDYEFVKFSLQLLPRQSFIIFFFSADQEKFIQIANNGGNLFLDIPYPYEGVYHDCKKEVIDFLKSQKVNRKYWKKDGLNNPTLNYEINGPYKTSKGGLLINFQNNYYLAVQMVFAILEDILKDKDPTLYSYETNKLVPLD